MIYTIHAPKGTKLSEKYSVFVRQNDDWQPIDVYLTLSPDGSGNWIKLSDECYKEFNGLTHGTLMTKTYFASFAFEGKIDIKVKFNENVKNFTVKPRDQINFIQNGNEIEFSLSTPQKIHIEPDGDFLGSLHLFAEAPVSFDDTNYGNIIYFTKGFHNKDNNKNIILNKDGVPIIKGITDNTLVYAEQGAVIEAVIDIYNAKHVKIDGLGIFSLLNRMYGAECDFNLPVLHGGFREGALPSVFLHGLCDDVILQNVTLFCEFRGITVRNSTNIIIDNIKSFSAAVNGDGINMINVTEADIKNCYIQSSDDSFALFTAVDSINYLWDDEAHTKIPRTANITFHDCHLWTNARIFCIGGHATNKKVPRDVLENIKIYDCEIIADASNIYGIDYKHRLYWSGIFRILSQSEGLVRNIHFENFTVNWTKGYTGKPFHIEVRGNDASYTESSGYRVENVTFKNIHFHDVPQDHLPTHIKSVEFENKAYAISNIKFENITLDGTPLNKNTFLIEGNVENITVK